MNQNKKKVSSKDIKAAAAGVAEVVTSTMGGGGKLVTMITAPGMMQTTKDGANISANYRGADTAEDLLAAQIIDAANSVAKKSGDGTTLTTLLVKEMVDKLCPSFPFRRRNLNVVQEGMKEGLKRVMAHLELEEKIDDIMALESLIKTAMNGQDGDVLKNVTTAVKAAGEFGNIIIKYGDKNDVKIEKGLTVNNIGIASQYYNAIPDLGIEIDEALVLVISGQVRKQEDVITLMKRYEEELGLVRGKYSLPILTADGKRLPVVILTTGIQSEALTTLIKNLPQNNDKKPFPNYVYQVERMTPDELAEIKAAVGVSATVGEAEGLLFQNISNHARNIFGITKKVKLFKNKIVLVATDENEKVVNKLLEEATETYNESLSTSAKERVSRLSGSSAEVMITAHTTIGTGELYHRVEDAIRAGQSSFKGFFVRGGGAALFTTPDFNPGGLFNSFFLSDYEFGIWIVLKSVKSPLFKIAANAGVKITNAIKEAILDFKEVVLDVKDGKLKEDSQIIDSSYVIKTAIRTAIECAVNLAKHSFVINTNPEGK